jgi:hypothetical protein
MKRIRPLYCLLLLAPLLAACETDVPARTFPEIGFAHQMPINIDVASVEVENKPEPPSGTAAIVQELPVTPATVAERWARQRLHPVGQRGKAIVRIEKASVVEEKLKKTEGIRGAFVTDQTERYIGELQMSVTVVDDRGQATARAEARRVRSVPEDASLADREKLWFELVEHLAREVDSVLEQQVRTHLSNYLR